MFARTKLIFALLVPLAPSAAALGQTKAERVRVGVVATASEYVPRSTTVSHPGQKASAPEAQAALLSDVLSIGTVTLRLGMPKDAALSELGKHFALQEVQPSTESFDNWLIHDKTRLNELIGELRFRSGKLTLAKKEWTPIEKDYSGADTMEIIYKLASEFVDKGNVNCTIRTFASLQQPGPGSLEFRETEITCGHRQIELVLTWQSGPAWVQVSESITDEPEMPRKSDAPAGGQ